MKPQIAFIIRPNKTKYQGINVTKYTYNLSCLQTIVEGNLELNKKENSTFVGADIQQYYDKTLPIG